MPRRADCGPEAKTRRNCVDEAGARASSRGLGAEHAQRHPRAWWRCRRCACVRRTSGRDRWRPRRRRRVAEARPSDVATGRWRRERCLARIQERQLRRGARRARARARSRRTAEWARAHRRSAACEAWGQHERAGPVDPIERVEQDGMGAVPPRSLETEAHAAVEPRARWSWPTAGAADTSTGGRVAGGHARRRRPSHGDVHPTHLSERLIGRRHDAGRTSCRSCARRSAEQLQVARGGGVAGGKHGLFARAFVRRGVGASSERPCRSSTRTIPAWVHAATCAPSSALEGERAQGD